MSVKNENILLITFLDEENDREKVKYRRFHKKLYKAIIEVTGIKDIEFKKSLYEDIRTIGGWDYQYLYEIYVLYLKYTALAKGADIAVTPFISSYYYYDKVPVKYISEDFVEILDLEESLKEKVSGKKVEEVETSSLTDKKDKKKFVSFMGEELWDLVYVDSIDIKGFKEKSFVELVTSDVIQSCNVKSITDLKLDVPNEMEVANSYEKDCKDSSERVENWGEEVGIVSYDNFVKSRFNTVQEYYTVYTYVKEMIKDKRFYPILLIQLNQMKSVINQGYALYGWRYAKEIEKAEELLRKSLYRDTNVTEEDLVEAFCPKLLRWWN